MSHHSLKKELHIRATKEAIFDALTSSEEIIKYFPLLEVESDWIVGGEVLYKGQAGDGNFTDFGIIEKLDRPNEYQYRYWSDNHGTDNAPENTVIIRYKLEDEGNGSRLQLEQHNLPSKALFDLMNDYVWDQLLESLRVHVETSA